MLSAHDVACVRGDRPLFSGINFELASGQALYVTGSNGAGKTSLLRMLCGLSSPAEGEVRWDGESIASLREDFFQHLLYLGHAAALKDELSAVENLITGATLSGHSVDPQAAWRALGEIGLRGREDLPARVLSQGQRRRVNLARLLLPGAPRLWVLDEPFNALDVKAVAHLAQIIGDHLASGGMVIYTTHQEVSFPDSKLKQLSLASGKGVLC